MERIILLNKKYKSHLIIYLITIFFLIILTFLSFKIKTYDLLNITGLINCDKNCEIEFVLPYNKVDILSEKDIELKYLDNHYKISEIIYDDPYLNNEIPYQNIRLKTNIKSENRIINFKIIYNKQRMIEKFYKIISERWENEKPN